MPRPMRPIATLTFAICALSFAGCSTVYTRVYSPKKGHFVPVEEKSETLPPLDAIPPVDGPASSIQAPNAPPPAALDPLGAPPPL